MEQKDTGDRTLKFLKSLGILVVLAIAASLLRGWYFAFIVGQYYVSATILMTILFGFIWPILIVYGTYRAIRWIISANLPIN